MLKKTALLAILVLFLSATIALVFAEILIKYSQPQMTLNQAKLVSLRTFAKSDFLPYELIKNHTTSHIGHTHEFDYTININDLGLRGKEIQKEKPDGIYRILMLGDSITFGWGVEDDQSFPALLEKLLNEKQIDYTKKVEVINAGFTDGFATDTFYLYLKEKGIKLNPDLVIVNFFVRNDVSDLFETVWVETDDQGYPLKISSKLRELNDGYFSYIDRDWKMKVPLLNNSHVGILTLTVLDTKAPKITKFIKNIFAKTPQQAKRITDKEIDDCLYRNKCSQDFNDQFNKTEFILKGIKNITDEQGKQLVVALIPEPDQLKSVKNAIKEEDKYAFIDTDYNPKISASKVLENTEPQKRIKNILNHENIEYIDILADLISSNPEELYFALDGHYRFEGNQKIAEALANYFK